MVEIGKYIDNTEKEELVILPGNINPHNTPHTNKWTHGQEWITSQTTKYVMGSDASKQQW